VVAEVTQIYWVVSDATHQSFLRLADYGGDEKQPIETIRPLGAERFSKRIEAIEALEYYHDFCASHRLDRILTATHNIKYDEGTPDNDTSNQDTNQNTAV
jgi:hypothetical protein